MTKIARIIFGVVMDGVAELGRIGLFCGGRRARLEARSVKTWICSLALGVLYGMVTVLSAMTMVPISEGRPVAGPLAVVFVLNFIPAVITYLMRRYTLALPYGAKFVVLLLSPAILVITVGLTSPLRDVPQLLLFGSVFVLPVWVIFELTAKGYAEREQAALDE